MTFPVNLHHDAHKVCPRCNAEQDRRDYCPRCKLVFLIAGLKREVSHMAIEYGVRRAAANVSVTGEGLAISLDGMEGYHPELVEHARKWTLEPLQLDGVIGLEKSKRNTPSSIGQSPILRRFRPDLRAFVLEFSVSSSVVALFDFITGGCAYCEADITEGPVYLDFYTRVRFLRPQAKSHNPAEPWNERHVPVCQPCRGNAPPHTLLGIPLLGQPTTLDGYRTHVFKPDTPKLSEYDLDAK